MRVNIDLTHIKDVVNPAFHWILTDTHRNVVCRGGAGSGKSVSIMMALLWHILKDLDKPNSHRFLVLRKTGPAAKKSVFPLLKHLIDKWGLSPIVDINKTEGTFTFINGSEIMITSLDDPEKIKSLFGVDKIFLEEAMEFTLDDYRQLSLRMRGDNTKTYQLFMAFNPVSALSWIYKEFYTKEKPNTITHLSTYKDNPHLDAEYIRQLEDLINQDQNYYNVYTLGEFGCVGNVIYNNWTIVDSYPDNVSEEVWGLDFGYTHNMALVRVGITQNGIYLKEEIYEPKLTIPDLIEKIKVIINNGNAIVYADSAMPGSITEIARVGFCIRSADKAPHSVKEGIDYCRRQKLFITKDSPGIIKEIQGYAYKVDKVSNMTMEEPIKINDDLMDAMRYAIYTHLGKKKDFQVVF
jgi:phage terminase large subunit